MELGLKNNEIRLVDYTPEWNDEFLRIKHEIKKYTNIEEQQIEHIGSTAIRGMLAKPILDILIGINNIQNIEGKMIDGLKTAGFLRLKVERPEEIIFAKFIDNTYKVKTHYIHLVDFESKLWNNLIFFRDYLNSNESAKMKYLGIKLDYLKKSSTGIKEYTAYKEEFVNSIYACYNNPTD